MNAKMIYNKALGLLGYNDDFGLSDIAANKTGIISIVNAVYSDIYYIFHSNGFCALTTENEELELPENALNDCLVYGVAMYIAIANADSDSYDIFSEIYEHKRALLRKTSVVYERNDVLPKGCDF